MLKYKCACKRFSLKLLRIRECFRDFINDSKYCLIKVVTAGVKLSDSSSGVPTYSIQTSPPRTGTGNNQVGQGTRRAWTFQFHSVIGGGRWPGDQSLKIASETGVGFPELYYSKCRFCFCQHGWALFTNPSTHKILWCLMRIGFSQL